MRILRLLPALALTLALALAAAAEIPNHLYLTWLGDTSTTMMVQFHTADAVPSEVLYDVEARTAPGDYAFKATGSAKQIAGLEDGRYIHAVELTGLQPATTYHFAIPGGKTGTFRTLANDSAPVRALFGGDLGVLPLETLVLKQAAKQDPDVAVLGGDIAYANGDLKNMRIWDIWFARWEEHMVRSDGALIPMIVGIGNHEVNKSDATDPLVRAPFFFGFFAQGGQSYFTRNLGKHAHIVVLDTGHITPHADQVDFLRASLEAGKAYPYLFTVYHVPFYPSHRSFDDQRSINGRTLWQPLFDEFRVTAGFEHHDHTFKRTKPIKAGEVNPEGTVYLGDGSMGVAVRSIDNKDAWYLEKADSKAHFWIADIKGESVHCKAVDHLGAQFDEVTLMPRKP
jgi:hypothetical protein